MNGKLRNMASVYLTIGDKILLLYRIGSRIANESYVGTGGGHFEQNELNDAKACALRELKEEIGLREDDIEELNLRYITLRLKDNEVRQNYYFFAELKDANCEIISNEGILKWFSLDEIQTLNMPFSAKCMMEHWVKTGRFDNKLYGGIATEQGISFTEIKEF